ncbi:DNA polymerase [Pseudomonas phage vB_PaM_EPA1]|uniref:DNA polymerase n=1 Tax=Pseudomonas phage vB_PaM_EPA1 TaxID=2587493 RepID=A0A4Y6EA93_9CAUD|nr:DNA polymerase [Pseudomonas phage vB_PaM_EPA1]QDF15581.1 DNA polymerase [Pseudomonas phage vB_PaM_EPA1]
MQQRFETIEQYLEWMGNNNFTNMTWDIEATGLLDETSIDYTASPYKIKPSYKHHCIVVEEHGGNILAFYDGPTYVFDGREYTERLPKASSMLHTEEVVTLKDYTPVEYIHLPLKEFKNYVLKRKIKRVVAHNMINFDLMSMKLVEDMDFTIGVEHRDGGLTTWSADTWMGKQVVFDDTLVISKTCNPDLFGGHSLDKLSRRAGGDTKIDFRKHLAPDVRFLDFAADMLYYCIYDVKANTAVWHWLQDHEDYQLSDRDNYIKNWLSPIQLEKKVAEIITYQEHRGFVLNVDLCEKAVKDLDAKMEERRARVEPVLPPRPATKKFMADYTPPKRQFKQNGEITSYLQKFIERIGAQLKEGDDRTMIFEGKEYKLPLPVDVPLKTEMPAKIGDTTHIKQWLMGEFGWIPSEWKETDLTVDQKKIKLPMENIVAKIDRWLDVTYSTAYKEERLDGFGDYMKITPRSTRAYVRQRLIDRASKGGCKVLTNPSFTKGQEKEMCPDLERIAEQFPFAKDVIEYLTFKHRRSAILGGGMDWDEMEDGEEPEKGYLASIRQDGRIPTPADTCGAATSRMKHRKVANVPRITSLYGAELRELFGVGDGFFQIGYDFDSLEARKESAYCDQYDPTKEYCKSLMMEKPFDVHTMMAKRISEIIGRQFNRSPAKNVKYGCTYGAQAGKVAKTIGADLQTGQLVFDAFWDAAFPLKALKDDLTKQWEANGKKYIVGVDGRRVPTRSAHAILNSLFQSGGVICAKRAMVIHDQLLEKEGLKVDFFKEDWKNKPEFCQQMIAYHDEAQLEVTAKSVSFKMFPWSLVGGKPEGEKEREAAEKELKALAQAYKDEQLATTGKVWSDIAHYSKGEGGVFVAYCRAGELATKAVGAAGEFYSTPLVPIELTAGYIVGRSWKDCH